MKRGRIEHEQTYFASIRQTLAEVNRDPKARTQAFRIEEFVVFDLPPYDFGGRKDVPLPAKSFKELKKELLALNSQRR